MRHGLKFFNLYGHILMPEPLKCAYRMAWANDGGRAKAFQSDYAYDKRRDSPEWNTDRMKEIIMSSVVGFLGIILASGCSPASDTVESRGDYATSKLADGARDRLDLDADLKELVLSFKVGDGSPVPRGTAITEKIMCISDTVVRTNFLERFHKTLLSLEFCGNDYMKLRNGIGSLERLHDVYLDALSRCGGGLEQNMIARLEFLKWFRKEMERTLMPEPPRPLPGLFVSRDLYLEGVKDKYALHLRWLEETFNDYALKKLPRESADRVRCQIEDFLKRRIRTTEEILHDRKERRRRDSVPTPREEVGVSVDI